MNFEQAAKKIKRLPQKPNNDELLLLYGLYKQATVGDTNTQRPGFWELTKKAKWESWKSFEGTSQESAKKQYVKLVGDLLKKYSR
jgi:diazepam-binding inhibitor (GABA receptor modulating acyl-CoA-binding protein)